MSDFLNPMGKRRDEQKDALDRQTSYQTLLPHMDEGFHSGYQSTPGIVSDQNQRPREWLENVARYMQTQGEDVGYSIPDVLAGEQQLRRLSRLPHEMAMRHQEMIDFRAVLALLLLWDSWQRDETWPELVLTPLLSEDTAFSRSVLAALDAGRAREGLFAFTLISPQTALLSRTRTLCMLSRAMVAVPAADPGDLSAVLPPLVTWYDHRRSRFMDPCPYLNEVDLTRLIQQLNVLKYLNEHPEPGAVIYSPDAHLCALLDRFLADLIAARGVWLTRLNSGDAQAENELRIRLLATYGLNASEGTPRVTQKEIRIETRELLTNPLVNALLTSGELPYVSLPDQTVALTLLDGLPLAVGSAACVLMPCRMEGEDEALRRAEQECALLERFNPDWCRRVGTSLAALCEQLKGRVGVSEHAQALIAKWADGLLLAPARGDRGVTLRYPMREYPQALCDLLRDTLGITDRACVENPFSDCLVLLTDAEQPPYESRALNTACTLENDDSPTPRYAIAPLSPMLCRMLQAQEATGDPSAPRIAPQGLRFTLNDDHSAVEARFQIVSRTTSDDADMLNAVTFIKTYPLSVQPQAGAAFALPAHAAPFVMVWPAVRLPATQWQRYYVYAHRPDTADVWAFTAAEGEGANERAPLVQVRGQAHTAFDESTRRRGAQSEAATSERRWQTIQVNRFPAYVALKRGELSLGALLCDCPRRPIKHEPPAIVGLDFGSIATTVMLRQGEKVQPAVLPRCMHRALLRPLPGDEAYLADELLPKDVLLPAEGAPSTFYSVMDMFAQEPEQWQSPLVDGHIYYRESLNALLQKGENTLYYNMKWGGEDYALRCTRLFLKQVMLQASLSARLFGSPSISWRVSMPTALPLDRQEAYLEVMRGLSREVAAETGLPLTPGCPPVLYATENQADGLYFLSRNEVNATSGYLNLDIGGSTTDLSLWLGGATRATAECSLTLGCRQMLFDSLCQWHIDDFEHDFDAATPSCKSAAQEVARALTQGASTTRGQQKGMFLLDDFFADCAIDIRAAMAKARGEGRVSYVESLLLFNIGFLFTLTGELLQRAFEEPELAPLLPARMELCIAGNGGQLLKCFDDEQREKLCRLALARLSATHPLTALLPVQSRHPKQEVAIGLVSDESRLQSTLLAEGCWNGTPDTPRAGGSANLLKEYLPAFFAAFPQAARRLMPRAFEDDARRGGASLTPTAAMELDTIFENERMKTPQDDMATCIRCFEGLKRLWRT